MIKTSNGHVLRRPARDWSGVRFLGFGEASNLVRLRDGTNVELRDPDPLARLDNVSPNGAYVARQTFTKDEPDRVQAWLRDSFLLRPLQDPYVIEDIEGWGRRLVVPHAVPVSDVPTFAADSGRVATQTADHCTIHVWDLPARPTVGQMLLWSLVVNGPLFLVTWWWSSAKQRT